MQGVHFLSHMSKENLVRIELECTHKDWCKCHLSISLGPFFFLMIVFSASHQSQRLRPGSPSSELCLCSYTGQIIFLVSHLFCVCWDRTVSTHDSLLHSLVKMVAPPSTFPTPFALFCSITSDFQHSTVLLICDQCGVPHKTASFMRTGFSFLCHCWLPCARA